MGGKVGCGPSYVFTKIAMHARSHSATQSLSHSANPLLSHSANQPLRLSRYGGPGPRRIIKYPAATVVA